jgi:spermidine synthase
VLLKNARKPREMFALLLLSFIEGGCVMSTELIGAKMLAPYFGTSLYVWSAVLASTLMALALGYFIGGLISSKSNRIQHLMLICIAGGLLIMLMPFITKLSVGLFASYGLLLSIIASSIFILIPPLLLMGCVSPLIIAELSKYNPNAGMVSGSIYALSTVGGILFTFLFGFVIIPLFGLQKPLLLTGLLISALPLIYFIQKKEKTIVIVFVVIAIVSLAYVFKKQSYAHKKVLLEQDGMLGKLSVVDFIDPNNNEAFGRSLMVNNITQTYLSANYNLYFDYHKAYVDIVKTYPQKSSIVQLGLGGGTLTQTIYSLGYTIIACEIDKRIYSAAVNYFNLDETIPVIIDDARHFINQLKTTHEIIIFDLFKGEEPAYHVFTLESFQTLRKNISSNSVILMNTSGYIEGSIGKGNRALINTLIKAGYFVHVHPQGNDIQDENQRNFLIIASLSSSKLTEIESKVQLAPKINIPLNEKSDILSDDNPKGEMLYAESVKMWRKHMFYNQLLSY